MADETRARIDALTAGFVELCAVLARSQAIEPGDLDGIQDRMLLAVRGDNLDETRASLRRYLTTAFGEVQMAADAAAKSAKEEEDRGN